MASAERPEDDPQELKRADDFITAFAASHGLTPKQFDARVGYPHERLVFWTAGLLNGDPMKFSASERLGFIANLEEPSATEPKLAKKSLYRPQISLTASELSMRFDGAPKQAITDLSGRVAVINGKISGRLMFGFSHMPPRIRVFDGFLVGYTKSQGIQTGPRFRSFPQYYLDEEQVLKFSALREGDSVSLVCQVGAEHNRLLDRLTPDLTGCLIATQNIEQPFRLGDQMPAPKNKTLLPQSPRTGADANASSTESAQPKPSVRMSDADFNKQVQAQLQAAKARKTLQPATSSEQCISLIRVAAMADAYVRQCGQRPGISQAAMDHYSRSNCARVAAAEEINITRKQVKFDSVADFNREGAQAYCREAGEFYADKAETLGIE